MALKLNTTNSLIKHGVMNDKGENHRAEIRGTAPKQEVVR